MDQPVTVGSPATSYTDGPRRAPVNLGLELEKERGRWGKILRSSLRCRGEAQAAQGGSGSDESTVACRRPKVEDDGDEGEAGLGGSSPLSGTTSSTRRSERRTQR